MCDKSTKTARQDFENALFNSKQTAAGADTASLLGKASISFQAGQYSDALQGF